MNNLCPHCLTQFSIDVMEIVDERVIQCPNCSTQFQIRLSPSSKHAMESSNKEVLDYMSDYPHERPLFNGLPSGVKSTFE